MPVRRCAVRHGDEEVEGWHGEIRDGEVVRTHEEACSEEDGEEDEYRDAYDEEDEYGEGEENEENEEDETADEYDDAFRDRVARQR
ncbi:hypothetical protein [Streptomyces sp. NPDC058145]|uniref:hypothetical protein n=1 Tax=Streptomyces sp. NPDC058145 TaxID=3346356 RepID=UPI0036EBFA5D